MGAMKVGAGSDEDRGGEGVDGCGGRELVEEEEGGRGEEVRASEGEEAVGSTGVRKEDREGLVLGAAAGAELAVLAGPEDGGFVLAVGAAQVGQLDPRAAGAAMFMLGVNDLSEFICAGLESEFTGGAAGGFAAGKEASVGGSAAAASVGVEDLRLSPAEGDGALTSSTGLVPFLRDRFFSSTFFLPPSPLRAGKLCSSLSWISISATFLSSSSLARRSFSVRPKDAASNELRDFLLVLDPPWSSTLACGGHECCFCMFPLELGAAVWGTAEDAGTVVPLPRVLSSHSPCPLLGRLSRLTTVLQPELSEPGGRRFHSGTFSVPSSSAFTFTRPLLGGTSLMVAL